MGRVSPIALRAELCRDLPYDPSQPLTSDLSDREAVSIWLLRSFWSKYQDEIGPGADERALEVFRACNSACASFELEPKTDAEMEVIERVKDVFDNAFHRGPDLLFDPFVNFREWGGLGPGVNVGGKSDLFYQKMFDSPLTMTSDDLYRMYIYTIQNAPSWLEAERLRDQRYGHRVVAGSKFSFVPKKSDISRTISAEPILNMFFQKGIDGFLLGFLRKRFSIELDRQPELNQELARLGSLNGEYATIDLKSASDCISRRLCASLIPPYFLRWLERVRSPSTVLPTGEVLELHMLSTMGNGYTFSLQTALFASLVVACYSVLGIKPVYASRDTWHRYRPGNFAVFGDDIVVRKDAYDFVCRMLGRFGFTVNVDKSFSAGSFRESCGKDYFRGLDIRGVYLKTLKHDADIYSIANRLVRWSHRHEVRLPNTLRLLSQSVRFLPVPPQESDDAGFKVSSEYSLGCWCDLHGGYHYRARVQQPNPTVVPLEQRSFRGPKGLVGYNAPGLLVAFIGGFIRNGTMTARNRINRYRTVWRHVPNWDYLPPDYGRCGARLSAAADLASQVRS